MSIEATNEYRRDFELSEEGIVLTGEDGLCNAPKNPKTWYQFGQRIVAWSRIAQHVAMQLVGDHAEAIICGDTDSFKLYCRREEVQDIDAKLKDMGRCIDIARDRACERVKARYAEHYHELGGIGYYVSEGCYDGFSASWNKSYVTLHDGRIECTIAGLPTARGEHSVNAYCDELLSRGFSFYDIACSVIGYNTTFDYSLTKLNARKHPEWGRYFDGEVTDYMGRTSHVRAPMMIALYPEPKTIGGTDKAENEVNACIAQNNNPNVNTDPVTLYWDDEGIGAVQWR